MINDKCFNDLARFEQPVRWTHNSHYHPFILNEIGGSAESVLEVGCGAGGFCRLVSERAKAVVGIDLSAGMISKAKEFSKEFSNIEYRPGDYFALDLSKEKFDHIVSIATAHHFSLPDFIRKARGELKPGGKLIILDLFEPEIPLEKLMEFIAFPVSRFLGFWHKTSQTPEEQKAWETHAATDEYLTMHKVREIAAAELPGSRIRRHLLWRYSLVWDYPGRNAAADPGPARPGFRSV